MKTFLILFILLLTACSSVRHSAGSDRRTTSDELRHSIDSMVASAFVRMSESTIRREGETVTDLIVYDTDKPVSDSTGLPPVKAALHREQRHRQTESNAGRSVSHSGAHISAATFADSRSETTMEEEIKKKPGTGRSILQAGIGVFLIVLTALAGWIFIKKQKSS